MLDLLRTALLDSPDRLRALRRTGVADNPPDHDIETMVALAADLVHAPVATISLFDGDLVWYRALHGRAAAAMPPDAALAPSFDWAGTPVFVVADMAADAAFAGVALARPQFGLGACAGATLLDGAGAPIGVLCVMDGAGRIFEPDEVMKLAELARAMASILPLHGVSTLENLTATDPLTGLANLALFTRQAQAAIDAAQENPVARVCAVLRIDLDRFSNLNELYGHADGELLLRHATARIRASLREVDIVGRIGSDQFAALLPGLRSPRDAAYVAERAIESLAQLLEIDGRPVRIPASVGIAVAPQDGTTLAGLLSHADAALQRVRREPASSVGRHTPAGDRRRDDQRSFEHDLAEAVEQDRLQAHWQPILRCSDGKLVGLETLTRWNRQGHGRVSPLRFIAVAEEIGLIETIDRWAMLRACRAAVAWPERLRCSVNVSAAWFQGEAAVRMVEECLAISGLYPHLLQIEVTEAVFAPNAALPRAPRRLLQRLRDMGVRVALDGFGTGIVSLAQLRDLPVDQVKLDAVFIEALGLNRRVGTVLRAVMETAARVGISVCAEGVVRESQLSQLQELGCDEIQGFLVGRPAPLGSGQLNACRAPGSARLFRKQSPRALQAARTP